MIEKLVFTIAVLVVLAGFGAAGIFDAQEVADQNDEYCDMVEMFEADRTKGWPPYRTDIDCEDEADE
jgi:hypothetical protein